MTQETNVITTELAKQNVTEAVIAKLKKDFMPLKINGIEDKEGYKKVKAARLQCRDVRVLAEKICKKGREDAVKIQKDWIAKEKEVVAQVSEIEQHLKKQEEAIDNEIEAQKIRAERLLKLSERKEQVIGLEAYIEEGIATTKEMAERMSVFNDEWIMQHDDAQWSQVIIEAKGRKIQEFEEKERKEKEESRQKRLIERTNSLYKAGAVSVMRFGVKNFHKGNIFIPEIDVADMDDELWESKYNELANAQGETPTPTMKNAVEAPIKTSLPGEYRTDLQGAKLEELSDEEILWNFAVVIEKLVVPNLKTEQGKATFKKAEQKLIEAINILKA